MTHHWVQRIFALVASTGVLCVAHAVPAASISEVRLGPPGTSDAYVELEVAAGEQPFDLAVLEARNGRNNRILTLLTVTPTADAVVVLLHEGLWPEPVGLRVQQIALTGGGADGALWLGGQFTGSIGTARHLVLFTGVTNLKVNATLSSLDPGIVQDIATYRVGTSSAVSDLGEPIYDLQPNQSLWRRYYTEQQPADFAAGAVDADGRFLSDPYAAINPGRTNLLYPIELAPGEVETQLPHQPEPATAGMLAIGAGVCLARRRNSAKV